MKIGRLFLIVLLLFAFQRNIAAFAEDCPNKSTVIGTYVGVIAFISCSELCEVALLLDDGTTLQHFAHDDFRQYEDKPGTRVQTTLTEEQYLNVDDYCETLMLFIDVVEVPSPKDAPKLNPKGEFGNDNIDYLLQTSSKVQEDRVGVTIKGLQLGMNEFSFLINIRELFPILFKNDRFFHEFGYFNDKTVQTDAYILVRDDESKLKSYSSNDELIKSIRSRFMFDGLSYCVFKDGQLDVLYISSSDFQYLFNVRASPFIVFVRSFLDYYYLDLDVRNVRKEGFQYMGIGDDGSWTATFNVSFGLDMVTFLMLKRNFRNRPTFE